MIRWTEYMLFRMKLRAFDSERVEEVVRFSEERYFDEVTARRVAVGRHGQHLILVPYEQHGDEIVPVTVHVTSREQINTRIRSGRLRHD